ncbi:hypothetical protein NQ317_017429 [Molorchus minor]|uniref:Transposase n=1 Tax=Molorchus minor TaxID=1323400 RepID=A0ABQ9IY74_9CUCU|nr:hypothetical protein NQ317_017429 [Molorchus minor]
MDTMPGTSKTGVTYASKETKATKLGAFISARKTNHNNKQENLRWCCKTTIFRTIKEYKSTGMVSISKHLSGRPGFYTLMRQQIKELYQTYSTQTYSTQYLKRSRKSVLIERDDIVSWRRDYLRSIKQFRREGRSIYFLDETWCDEGHTHKKKSKRDAFIKGLSMGLKNSSGKKSVSSSYILAQRKVLLKIRYWFSKAERVGIIMKR